jgi:MFS transporter, putative metabolite transport protein
MTPQEMPAPQAAAPGKTVQDYIDETPVWADATPVRHSPMTSMQWLIWGLAAAGKFFEGMVVFTTASRSRSWPQSSDWARPKRG